MRELPSQACLEWPQTSRPTSQNLNIYIEASTEFSLVRHPDGLNTTSLPQGCVLGEHLVWGRPVEPALQGRAGGGWCKGRGASHCPGPAGGSNLQSRVLDDLLQCAHPTPNISRAGIEKPCSRNLDFV